MRELLLKKGNDYSGRNENQDRLSNFKQAAAICQSLPELSCLNLMAIKISRLSVLISNDYDPMNESLDDNAIDLLNYSMLLLAIIVERKQDNKQLKNSSDGNKQSAEFAQ